MVMRLEVEGGCGVELWWSYWLDGMDPAGWPVTVLIGGGSGVSCRCGWTGQYAAASKISRGPVFGSVPMPVKMPPRFWVSTQMAAALMTARARAGRVAAGGGLLGVVVHLVDQIPHEDARVVAQARAGAAVADVVEDVVEVRTQLEAVFNILLCYRQRLGCCLINPRSQPRKLTIGIPLE